MLFSKNHRHFKCTTKSNTRTLIISLNRPDRYNPIGQEMLAEMEDILGKVAFHHEIYTILIKGESEGFSDGIDREELKKWNLSDLNIFNNRLKKIVTAMFFLPQIVIVDLGNRAKGHALELSLGADIRLAREDAHIEFDFLSRGLCPSAGGIIYLQKLVGHSKARFWILSSHKLSYNEIREPYFIHKIYKNSDHKSCMEDILMCIYESSPVCRVQAKRSLLETFLESFEKANAEEANFARAAHFCEDWRRAVVDENSKLNEKDFTSLKTMKSIIRMAEKGLTT